MDDPRPAVPLLRSLEGLRLVSSVGILSIHMFPHVGWRMPDGFDLFVDLFFVISGIVIGQIYAGRIAGRRDYAVFVRRRLARIYPLHLATLLFYVAVGAAVARYGLRVDDPARFDPARILPNLLLVHAWFPDGRLSFNFVSWSISAEFLAYLCFPAVAAMVTRGPGRGLAALALLLAACVAVAELGLGAHLYALRWDGAIPRVLPSFAFGVYLSRFGAGFAGRPAARFAPALVLVLGGAAALGMALDASGYLLLALVWGLVAAAYLCDLRGAATPVAWGPLSRRGYLTYSLYMLHVPVATVFLSFLFPRVLGTSPGALAASLGLSLLILFAVAEASFRLFEDPLRRVLR